MSNGPTKHDKEVISKAIDIWKRFEEHAVDCQDGCHTVDDDTRWEFCNKGKGIYLDCDVAVKKLQERKPHEKAQRSQKTRTHKGASQNRRPDPGEQPRIHSKGNSGGGQSNV